MSEIVILLDNRGRRHLVSLDAPMARVRGVGTLNSDRLRANIGRGLRVGDRTYLVLTPSVRDLGMTMHRGAQTIIAKDLAAILFEANVGAGARVVEAGAGSGGLTLALARAVRPTGRVTTLDVRDDAIRLARENVDRAGLSELVEFRKADVRKGVPERDVDAVVLDIPDPWAAIPAAWECLRVCGHLVTFSPNMEQVKGTVEALRARPFAEVRTIELLEREIEVRDFGVRPSFAALGHTGYLTFARKVLEGFR